MSFKEDLNRGKIGEQLFLDYCNEEGIEVKDVSNDYMYFDSDIDFITADGNTYEIKTDYRFSETGNLAIELGAYYPKHFDYRDGWIYSSNAKNFVFVCPYSKLMISISRKNLMFLLRTEKLERKEKDDGYKQIEIALLPYREYEEWFNILREGAIEYTF